MASSVLVDAWTPARRRAQGWSETPADIAEEGDAPATEPERWWMVLEPTVDAPSISVSLRDFGEMGSVVGYAVYWQADDACAYDLILSERSGETLRVRQHPKSDGCVGRGPILLRRQGPEALIGEWYRPDGSRWFRGFFARQR